MTTKEKILKWDFQTKIQGNDILLTPIPMSYEGKTKVEELEKILEKTDESVYPIFSGDGKVIYCFCPLLALKLRKNGHKLLPTDKQEFTITI